MYYYIVFGLKVMSDYRMEAAQAVAPFPDMDRDVLIHAGSLHPKLMQETELDRAHRFGCVVHYEQNWSWVRASGTGCFVTQGGNEILYQLKEEFRPDVVPDVILCFCLPVLLIQRQRLVVHGSGLLWNGRAVIVSGESGAGKSTLAFALRQSGAVFMADDAVPVNMEDGVAYAYPAFPQQKLCEDALVAYQMDIDQLIRLPEDEEGEKFAIRFAPGEYCAEKKELSAMFILQVRETERGYLEEITGAEKLRCFIENLYKQSAYKRMGLARSSFEESTQILGKIRLYRLVRPVTGMPVAEELALLQAAMRLF